MSKICFITENSFNGKVARTHANMRVEMAWMCALQADHFNITQYNQVSGYDYVMVIFPKGGVYLNSEGIELVDKQNRFSDLYKQNFIYQLKQENKHVCFVQEGPVWYCNDFSIEDQFNYYNQVAECDIIFTHNKGDTAWYKGMFPGKRVEVLPTLIIEDLVGSIGFAKDDKVLVAGNMAKWYGGFQSYMVADEFHCEKWVPSMHNRRKHEDQMPNLKHLPYMNWFEWMKSLAKFKYVVHLMPTVAAGTTSLNAAYLGIPCIGNEKVDTQNICFPSLSVDPENVDAARQLAKKLYTDKQFYSFCSVKARELYRKNFSEQIFLEKMKRILV